ncbi:MAG: hypothetical protein ABMB14_20185 [Myxococcota bacterium]
MIALAILALPTRDPSSLPQRAIDREIIADLADRSAQRSSPRRSSPTTVSDLHL